MCPGIAIGLITIDRIASQITACIQRVNDDGLAGLLLYLDGDRTVDTSTIVITAIYLTIDTIGDNEFHIIVHVGISGASEELAHIIDAFGFQTGLTVDFGILAGIVSFIDDGGAVRACVINRMSDGTDITLLVTTAVRIMDAATHDVGLGYTLTVQVVKSAVLLANLTLAVGIGIDDGLVGVTQ